jgi:hypothetical protein
MKMSSPRSNGFTGLWFSRSGREDQAGRDAKSVGEEHRAPDATPRIGRGSERGAKSGSLQRGQPSLEATFGVVRRRWGSSVRLDRVVRPPCTPGGSALAEWNR